MIWILNTTSQVMLKENNFLCSPLPPQLYSWGQYIHHYHNHHHRRHRSHRHHHRRSSWEWNYVAGRGTRKKLPSLLKTEMPFSWRNCSFSDGLTPPTPSICGLMPHKYMKLPYVSQTTGLLWSVLFNGWLLSKIQVDVFDVISYLILLTGNAGN